MARPLGSGPIHVYGAFGIDSSNGNAVYYGTTREGPDIVEEPSFYPIMNDLSGPRLSLDEGYAGREDVVSLVMSSWLESFDQALEHFLDPTNATFARGREAISDRGTMMLFENKCLSLWLVKAAALKAANVAAGMPLGRKYIACVPVGPHRPIEGNKENLRVRIFRAKNEFSLDTGITGGSATLFREDAAAFSGLPAPTMAAA